ncbi:hypothetical protein CE91St36_19890 [Christensenellaceae bacterium]|uniref:hypothetical protein n=1 Tax=Christensenella timonensis TaxID=1816678 RepID=UPI0008353C16|nr:hypothetical protein [Christensenella timonensis]BDF59172.1 hypothetical protein CE91St36_19890 [Christensenellaceae bacterium]BDF61838.1 hypothetical protein CE91St37_19880 [Christensenellaceae bacterium]
MDIDNEKEEYDNHKSKGGQGDINQEIESFAQRIFDFYNEVDPYEVAAEKEYGETEDDLIAKTEKEIRNPVLRKNLIESMEVLLSDLDDMYQATGFLLLQDLKTLDFSMDEGIQTPDEPEL